MEAGLEEPFGGYLWNQSSRGFEITGGESVPDQNSADGYGREFIWRLSRNAELFLFLDVIGTFHFGYDLEKSKGERLKLDALSRRNISFLGFSDLCLIVYCLLKSVIRREGGTTVGPSTFRREDLIRTAVAAAQCQLNMDLTRLADVEGIVDSVKKVRELQVDKDEFLMSPENVTYVIGDMVGSTKLGAGMSVAKHHALINQMRNGVQKVYEKFSSFGGSRFQFTEGDGFVCCFRDMEKSGEDLAYRFVKQLANLNWTDIGIDGNEFLTLKDNRLQFRFGINTGLVPSALIGNLEMPTDPLNLCGKFEKHAQAGNLLMGEMTFHGMSDALRSSASRELGEAEVKVHGIPHKAYQWKFWETGVAESLRSDGENNEGSNQENIKDMPGDSNAPIHRSKM